MSPLHLLIILYTTVLTVGTLYPFVPLLPLLQREFSVPMSHVMLLMTLTLLPLSLAPIFYGYLLQTISARRMLQISVFLLAVSNLPFLWVDNFWILVGVRAVQGFLIPAILTGLTTYLATESNILHLKRNVTWYVAATIVGGFSARLLAGMMATYFHWRYTFIPLIIGLFLSAYLLQYIQQDSRLNFVKPAFSDLVNTVRHPVYRKIYIMIFLLFFAFTSVLTLLPFRLKSLDPHFAESWIGFMYFGYLMGIFAVTNSLRIIDYLRGEANTVWTVALWYSGVILLFMLPYQSFLFINMFAFCGCLFLAHAALSSLINGLMTENKGIGNGLYIAFYYAGGTLGSYLPLFIYQWFGWDIYLLLLANLMVIVMGLAYRLSRVE